jgi:uncharacterized DUF497 family protein
MRYEWDEVKNAANVAKHGISFATASRIFDGPIVSAEDTRRDYGETRLNSIGKVADRGGLGYSYEPPGGRPHHFGSTSQPRGEKAL